MTWDVDSAQFFLVMVAVIFGFMRLASVPTDICLVWVFLGAQLAPYPPYWFALLLMLVPVVWFVNARKLAA